MQDIKKGDRVRVLVAGYSFDDAIVGRPATVLEAFSDGTISVAFDAADFPRDHPAGPDGAGDGWSYLANEYEPVAEAKPKSGTPARVRAQHAAERLVSKLFGCTREEARSDRLLRHAYRAAYKAFRQAQKGNVP